MSDQDLVVKRWRRYGKDRLYLESPEGIKIGFWDLIADTGHAESPDCEATLLTAVARWKSTAGSTPTLSEAVPLDPAAPMASVPTATAGPTAEPEPLLTSATEVPADPAPPSTEVVKEQEAISRPLDPPGGSPPANRTAPSVPTATPVRPWVDLATNTAGAEARERAQAARDSAPVKTVLARVLGVHTSERAWRIGADGEEKVAAQLAKVAKKDPRWRFLHAIPVGNRGSDIDHVIIGPGGVFTANTKHHPNAKIWVGGTTFLVNGAKQPYVRNARHEAKRAASILSDGCGFPVPVEGLIITVNASEVVVKSQPEGVSVTPRMQLAKWLLRHGDILTPEAIDAIYEVARRSTAWR